MITDAKNQIGVVLECYDHDTRHRILGVGSRETSDYWFFYISRTLPVDFGDLIQMNFDQDEYYICRGNSKLTYKINPLTFPGHLLWELITERLNQ